ncbi:hypothetical protein [uncultured Microbulbifer sp.]|uniref:hypothetical protein n=1 Tax=uncultured Microbulbifer sp. TaxID=348147 RepID=UPI002608AAD1|nr:hypothetical protein [uncultured Microbulbifer sp.]
MAELKLTFDASAFDRASRALQRQLPYAGAQALNNVAFRIRGEARAVMGRVFVNPTRLTLNAVLVDKATKHTGVARVYIRDQATKGTAPSKYLAPAVFGTSRNEKRFERALRYAGLLPAGMYVVPGEAPSSINTAISLRAPTARFCPRCGPVRILCRTPPVAAAVKLREGSPKVTLSARLKAPGAYGNGWGISAAVL